MLSAPHQHGKGGSTMAKKAAAKKGAKKKATKKR
jgi:hypothetical protein